MAVLMTSFHPCVAVALAPRQAVSWALFNVWRVAFRQVIRIGESDKGNPL